MKLLEYALEPRGTGWLVTFPHLGQVPHATSTRQGGVSSGIYDSLNLGLMSGDDLTLVDENRRIFSRMLGIPIVQNLSMTHGVRVAHLRTPQDMERPHDADACISNHPEVSLSLTTADCVPIFFYDARAGAVGLAHAGWRGTVNGIAARVVEEMADKLGSQARHLRVALGPAIGLCCFEVGDEVAEEFHAQYGSQAWIEKRATKWHIDLHQANRVWLERVGVSPGNIRSCPLCTCCRADLFYSWRRESGKTGRLLSAIALKPLD
ncbi:MAG: peptidoglycan editing factor PgeF [Candidatus Eremiobacteraeota bacterium]|nr:peptidoglycan editing factor PgeF [Candidatus Eremiobacteraeota bacterium]MCW5866329.1 peptidoglycan editing factor PgeF [Candidatus Eremiobacteraeota bacterium]